MFDFSGHSGPTILPQLIPYVGFRDAHSATARLVEIYTRNTAFIRSAFADYAAGKFPAGQRVRACYPAIRIKTHSYQEVDTRLSYGHVVEPGTYMTTVTHPHPTFHYPPEPNTPLITNPTPP